MAQILQFPQTRTKQLMHLHEAPVIEALVAAQNRYAANPTHSNKLAVLDAMKLAWEIEKSGRLSS